MENDRDIRNTSVYPILVLEDYFHHSLRHTILGIMLPFLALFGILLGGLFWLNSMDGQQEFIGPIFAYWPKLAGVFLILFSFWLMVYLAEAFYRAIYFHNRSWKLVNAPRGGSQYEISSEVASVFYHCPDRDIIRAFFLSSLGESILLRCGISGEDVREFLDTREHVLEITVHDAVEANVVTMNDFALFLFKNYGDFSHFLFQKGIPCLYLKLQSDLLLIRETGQRDHEQSLHQLRYTELKEMAWNLYLVYNL